jgi:hypothetical protein
MSGVFEPKGPRWLSPAELEEDGWYVLTFTVGGRATYVDINIDLIHYAFGHWTCKHSGGPLRGTERLYGPVPMERKIGPEGG